MNVSERIAGVEQRAKRLNVAIYRVCMEAGVSQANLTRWKAGGSPSLRIFERDMSRLEEVLTRREAEMLDALSRETAPRKTGACEMRGVSAA
jgi:hypothetical protein